MKVGEPRAKIIKILMVFALQPTKITKMCTNFTSSDLIITIGQLMGSLSAHPESPHNYHVHKKHRDFMQELRALQGVQG